MDIESFVSLKTSSELEILSNEIINIITLLSSNKKIFKNIKNINNINNINILRDCRKS